GGDVVTYDLSLTENDAVADLLTGDLRDSQAAAAGKADDDEVAAGVRVPAVLLHVAEHVSQCGGSDCHLCRVPLPCRLSSRSPRPPRRSAVRLSPTSASFRRSHRSATTLGRHTFRRPRRSAIRVVAPSATFRR